MNNHQYSGWSHYADFKLCCWAINPGVAYRKDGVTTAQPPFTHPLFKELSRLLSSSGLSQQPPAPQQHSHTHWHKPADVSGWAIYGHERRGQGRDTCLNFTWDEVMLAQPACTLWLTEWVMSGETSGPPSFNSLLLMPSGRVSTEPQRARCGRAANFMHSACLLSSR